MTDIADTIRVIAAATWTEIAGASAVDKTAITSGDRALLDVQAQNWSVGEATIELAITADGTSPGADTEFGRYILPIISSAANTSIVLLERLLLPSNAHVWIKSDQTDTRVLVNGQTETV